MNVEKLLRESGRIVWRYKPLWALGIAIAACGGQNPAASVRPDFNFQVSGSPEDLAPFLRLFEWLSRPAVFVPLLGGGFVLGLIFFVVASLAEGALIGGVQQASNGQATLGSALAVGQNRLWPVLIVRLLIGVSLVAPLLIVLIPILLYFGRVIFATGVPPREIVAVFGALFACLLPLVCLLALMSIFLGWLEVLALRAMVIEGLGVWAALRRGWQLLRGNFGRILSLWFILVIAQIVVGYAISLPLGLIGGASALPLLLEFAATGRFPSRGLIPLAMGASIAWVISVAVGGVILTYVSSLWTLAYQQFTRPAGAPGSPPTPPVFQ